MNWITIKTISSAKIIASTGVWIFLVPVFVKTSYLLNDSIGGQYFAGVQLAPFSILLLYFSALSFFLGSIFYNVFCPVLIKLTDSFNDFKSEGMSEHNLTKSLTHLDTKSASSFICTLRSQASEANSDDINSEDYFTITPNINCSINLKKDQLSNAFWITLEFLSTNRTFWRFLITSLYLIGSALLLIIFIRNLEVVAVYTLDTFFTD